jgi:ABC-type branched-subunit amino acid transport system ATPase component
MSEAIAMSTISEPARASGSHENGSLRCHGIDVRFGGLAAVTAVDFEAAPNEIVGLIGPNGAGKTTLVNVLSGFQRPTSGEVWLGDTRIDRRASHWISRHGVVRSFQAVRLFQGLSVSENIEVGAVAIGASRSDARERAGAIMKWLDLASVADVPVTALPYGIERRIGIARAFAMQPRFLLLDEPAAGLTIGEADELVKIILDVRDRIGCGVVIIEHNIRLIMNLCDRIQVLARGQTIATGSPAEIRANATVTEAYLGRSASKDHA